MTATLPIELDRASSEPLYRQVESNVRGAIDSGRLRPGQRLPSVRALAGQLGVGRLTIATAYEQLAAEGYLVGRMGFGTIVAPHLPLPASGSSSTAPRSLGGAPGRTSPVRLPPLRSAFGPGAALPASRRRLGPMPRYDLRAGESGGTGTAGRPGLAVGPLFERRLREEWRLVTESGVGSGGSSPTATSIAISAASGARSSSARTPRSRHWSGELGWLVEVRPRQGGTRLAATIVDPAWSVADVVRVAADAGVALDSLAPSRLRPGPDGDLVIDYGHHEPAGLRAAIRTLARAVAAPGIRAPGRGRPARLPNLPRAASPA